MSVNVHTEWGRLKEVVVGSVLNTGQRNVDLSFRLFYHQNIKHQILKESVDLQTRLVEQREEDLENLAEQLTKLGVRVVRPEKLEKVAEFETPNFTAHTRPMDNPRDLVLVAGQWIIETPVLTRDRLFETDLLKKTLYRGFSDGAKWICAPRSTMRQSSYDYSFVKGDPGKQDWSGHQNNPEDFEMMFDAAQCLKFGRHIVMNVSTQNHRLGAKWLGQIFGNEFEIVTCELTDHHIDGMIMPLKPGKLLLSPAMRAKKHLLPEHLKKWDLIEFEGFEDTVYDEGAVLLASQNISVNVLSIDENTVMVFSPTGEPPAPLTRALEKHGFNVLTVRLRHSKVFDGGLHCATLDLVREDKNEDYFS